MRCFLPSFLCPFVVLSHSTFCPFDVFLPFFFLSSFFPFQVLSIDVFPIRRFSHSTFCPSTFVTVGVFYFDILSVNLFFQPCRLVTTDLVLLELEVFYTDEDASKGEGLVMSVGVAHITAINDDEATGARHRPLFCNLTPLIKGVKNRTTTMLS